MADITWNRGPDLVSWTWELPLPPPTGNEWVAEWVTRLRDTPGDFGQFSGAWLELSQGEDRDFVLPADWEQLIAAVGELASVRLAYLYVDLRCRLPDGSDVVLQRGATLFLSTRRVADGANNAEDPPLLHLSLNTDIYDPDSSAGDNEETGALNAPRLRAFLERIEATGARYDFMDNPFAPGAHRYGFC
jgi:hypothetical protein